MDARDTYTAEHSQRLAEWALATARELGCSDDELVAIRWGAMLHDIGKIGVPDVILRKPGKLTDEEWEVVKKHPEIGAEIVAPVKKLKDVAPVIRAHQEQSSRPPADKVGGLQSSASPSANQASGLNQRPKPRLGGAAS